ncbi:hypothetical protein Glove_151g122 [Diversispora epigaea]|uniref:Uncharacterized protein n=1 Tax=Diversispora epigaea TaxID=1348612 RepID=A0A397IWQ4_9GLOM|nr:hypothetical protein Glove_151g122 [Diversispora epigaea]
MPDIMPQHFFLRVDGFEEITGKLSLHTGRMQEQLMITINKKIGDCSILIIIVFGSIHATIRHVAGTLYVLTLDHINRMVKLDSLTRESIRSFGDFADLMCRYMDDSFTFKNNTTIPKVYNKVYGLEPRSFLPYHGLNNKKSTAKIDKIILHLMQENMLVLEVESADEVYELLSQISRLQELYAKCAKIYRWMSLIEKIIEFEKRASRPRRYFQSSFRLLEE